MDQRDAEQVRLLSTLHFVLAGITALFACLPLIHVTVGVLMLRSPEMMGASDPAGPPPAFVGWIFVAVGSLFVAAGWALAAAQALAGKYLRRHRRHTFCTVVAGISCLFMPLGTALGVFSLVVLLRPQVRDVFDRVPLPAGAALPADPAWR